MNDNQNYLEIVDNILKKINQSSINQFEINNNDFYLKIKINKLKNENNLRNTNLKSKPKNKNEIIVSDNENNKKSDLEDFKERIEDGYKLVFYEENNEKFVDIISTLVGKFYFANNKNLNITKGAIVKANTILGYIEILNISYYIKLDFNAEIIEDYTENLPFVQYSSKLLKLKVLS